ncbi:MAG TPA: ABC transporter permease [Candidatus Hydrogenedentes bacterium]|nr:ABC transporter permease [Candidatus Hydrogenedentota bacterium]
MDARSGFWHVFVDEFREVLRNPAAIMIFLAGLLVYSLVYPVPYMREVLRNVPVTVVDEDGTSLSRKLTRWLDATEEIQLTEPVLSRADAFDRMVRGETEGVIVIPGGFERDVLRGEQGWIGVYGDACYFLIYRQVSSGALKAIATLSAGVEIRRFTAAGYTESQARKRRDPVPVMIRPLFNPVGGYASYVVPGVLLVVIQQTLLVGIGVVGGSRIERSRMPITAMTSIAGLTLGRALAYVSIYFMYPLFYMAVVYRVYSLPFQGNPIAVMVFVIPFLFAVAFLGLTVSMFFRTSETATPMLIYTSMPIIFLVGFAWPVEALPAVLRWLGMLIPASSGVMGFIRLNQMGATLYEVRREWLLLWGVCLLYFGTALWATARYFRRPPPPPPLV